MQELGFIYMCVSFLSVFCQCSLGLSLSYSLTFSYIMLTLLSSGGGLSGDRRRITVKKKNTL